jgi:chemotaxis protein MotB
MRVLKSLERSAPPPRTRERRRRRDDKPNHERWLVSYADFITLMFALFTTLYAISTVDAKKLESMIQSTQQAFEPGSAARRGQPEPGQRPASTPSRSADTSAEAGVDELRRQMTGRLDKDVRAGRVEIGRDRRGLVISIREAGSFAVGSADLSPDAQALLREIGAVLGGVGNQILVEGHTDDVPIHTPRFASNWELSTTRATNVIAFLLDHAGIAPPRVSAAGYAEHHPKAPNTSDANRTRNRRVDLIVLNPLSESGGETGRVAAH